MIAASAGVVFGIARLSWLARRTVRADRPVSRGEQVVAASVVVVGSLGTVVPFVASWTAVYHEAIQWGLAFALISYGALVVWMLDRRARDLVVAGAAAALSILARGSVGLGPVAAIGLVALVQGITALHAARAAGRPDWRPLVALGAAVLVPLVLYGYVNAAKFGSPLAPPPYARQDLLVDYPPRIGALDANGGSLFGLGGSRCAFGGSLPGRLRLRVGRALLDHRPGRGAPLQRLRRPDREERLRAELFRLSPQRRGRSRQRFDVERAIENLVDMTAGALAAPVSTEVTSRLKP